MIIKGASRRNIAFWSRHLSDEKKNDRAVIIETRGLSGESLRDMMREMMEDTRFSRAKNFMYIASFNPCAHEHLTEQQWEQAYEIFEKHRGIPPGQQRVVIEHEKNGRTHRHVIWNRIDAENMRAFPDGFNFRVCEAAQHEIELTLGLEQTLHLLNRDPEAPSPSRGPKSWELMRGLRSGFDPREVTSEVTALFRESHNPADFVAGLELCGYCLARGDRRDFVILDAAGDDHSLARRLKGVKTKELKAFMKDMDLSSIPTVDQARVHMQSRRIASLEADRVTVLHEIEWGEKVAQAAIEKEKVESRFLADESRVKGDPAPAAFHDQPQQQPVPRAPELGKTQGEIRLAFSLTSNPAEALNALEDRGYIVSKITQADIDKDLEKLHEEWEEHRRTPQTWMEFAGGYKELSAVFQKSAQRSFDEWQDARQKKDPNLPDLDPEQAEKALHSYVDYVQRKWAEGPSSQLERAIGGLAAVTPFGSVYTFTPRNTGIERDELKDSLEAIERAPLLSVTDAQDVMRDLQEQRRFERQARRPLDKTDGEIRLAYSLTQTGQEFADVLEDRGFILTIASPADVAFHDRHAHWREKERIERLEAYGIDPATRKPERETPLRVGDFLVVDQYGNYYPLTDRNTAPERERQARLEDIQLSPLPSMLGGRAVMRDYRQHQLQERDEQRRAEWLMKQPLGRVDGDIRLAASSTQSGPEFADALEDRGYILTSATSADIALYERLAQWKEKDRAEQREAVGDGPASWRTSELRPYIGELMVVDQYGTIHRLTDRNTGRAADERETWLSEVGRAPLPSVTLARAMIKDYQQHRQQEREEKREAWYAEVHAESQLDPITLRFAHSDRLDTPQQRGDVLMERAEANISYGEDRDRDYKFKPSERQQRDAFREAMENSGIAFAVVTPEEAYRSHREGQFAREIGRRSTAFEAGEIVVVTDRNILYQRDGAWNQAERVFKVDQAQAENYLQLLEFDKAKLRGIDETKTILDGKREERAAYWQDLRDESFFWKQFYSERVGRGNNGDIKTALRAFAGSTAAALDTVAKGFDIVAAIFDNIFSPKLTPGQIREAELSREDREIDAKHSATLANRTADIAQQRQNEQEQQAARDRQREIERER